MSSLVDHRRLVRAKMELWYRAEVLETNMSSNAHARTATSFSLQRVKPSPEQTLQWHSNPDCFRKTLRLCVNVVASLNEIDSKLSSFLFHFLCLCLTRLPLPRSLPPSSLFFSPLLSSLFLLSHLHHSRPAAPPLRCRRQRRRRKARWSWQSAASGSCWGEPPMAISRMPSRPCWCETTPQALLFLRSVPSLSCAPLMQLFVFLTEPEGWTPLGALLRHFFLKALLWFAQRGTRSTQGYAALRDEMWVLDLHVQDTLRESDIHELFFGQHIANSCLSLVLHMPSVFSSHFECLWAQSFSDELFCCCLLSLHPLLSSTFLLLESMQPYCSSLSQVFYLPQLFPLIVPASLSAPRC